MSQKIALQLAVIEERRTQVDAIQQEALGACTASRVRVEARSGGGELVVQKPAGIRPGQHTAAGTRIASKTVPISPR
jgi:hypothetical protein